MEIQGGIYPDRFTSSTNSYGHPCQNCAFGLYQKQLFWTTEAYLWGQQLAMTQAALSWLLLTLSSRADSDGDHEWRKLCNHSGSVLMWLVARVGIKAWLPPGKSIWVTTFLPGRGQCPGHLNGKRLQVFLGLLLVVLTAGISFEGKAIQQGIGLFLVCAIWFDEPKFILWWFCAKLGCQLEFVRF